MVMAASNLHLQPFPACQQSFSSVLTPKSPSRSYTPTMTNLNAFALHQSRINQQVQQLAYLQLQRQLQASFPFVYAQQLPPTYNLFTGGISLNNTIAPKHSPKKNHYPESPLKKPAGIQSPVKEEIQGLKTYFKEDCNVLDCKNAELNQHVKTKNFLKPKDHQFFKDTTFSYFSTNSISNVNENGSEIQFSCISNGNQKYSGPFEAVPDLFSEGRPKCNEIRILCSTLLPNSFTLTKEELKQHLEKIKQANSRCTYQNSFFTHYHQESIINDRPSGLDQNNNFALDKLQTHTKQLAGSNNNFVEDKTSNMQIKNSSEPKTYADVVQELDKVDQVSTDSRDSSHSGVNNVRLPRFKHSNSNFMPTESRHFHSTLGQNNAKPLKSDRNILSSLPMKRDANIVYDKFWRLKTHSTSNCDLRST